MSRDRLGLGVSLGLIVLTATILALTAVADVRGRQSHPEAAVRRYFAALEASDVEAALAEIAPFARGSATPFVENNVGNRYRVVGAATDYDSPLNRLAGGSADARTVTIFLEITQKDGVRWQAAPRVGLIHIDDRPWLVRPPLTLE